MKKILLIIAAAFILINLIPEEELTPEQQTQKNRGDIALAIKMNVKEMVKANLKDPESLKDFDVAISMTDSIGAAKGRSKNSFGGYSIFRAEFNFTYNDSIGSYRITNFKIQ